jgi:TatD DNase family protein
MRLIDTHAHLDHLEDIGQASARADREGVAAIVAVSTDVPSCRKNLEIKRAVRAPKIFLAMGIHPSDAAAGQLEPCARLIRAHRADLTAVGEIGLDFWYKWVRKDKQKKDEQRVVFRALLELAKELDLPAVIHTRGTWRESFETTKEAGLRRAEFHWYSGPTDVLRDILDAGYYISASPSLAYSPQSREAVSYAPIERTMLETDSPVSYRVVASNGEVDADKRYQAQPKDVFKTLEAYCALKDVEASRAAEIFNRNAVEFFQLNGLEISSPLP